MNDDLTLFLFLLFCVFCAGMGAGGYLGGYLEQSANRERAIKADAGYCELDVTGGMNIRIKVSQETAGGKARLTLEILEEEE